MLVFHSWLRSAVCSATTAGSAVVFSGARLAKSTATEPGWSVVLLLPVPPWRTLMRTAVLKPLGNFSFSLMMTCRRLSGPVSSCQELLYALRIDREAHAQRHREDDPEIAQAQRPQHELPQA